jgi:hypothetical protein
MLGVLRQNDARLYHRKTGGRIRQQPSIRVNIYRAAGSISQSDSGLAFEEQYPQPVAQRLFIYAAIHDRFPSQ